MNSKNLLSYNLFRAGSAWFFLLIGVGLYALGYFGMEKTSIWREVVIKIGDVLVIGVVLGYLSNAAQFLGVFKKDLQNIIYGKEFVGQRKDLYQIWETISKHMFKNKFPTIHKDFLNVINGYFPQDEVSFYNDYEQNTTIEWKDKERGIIKVTDVVSFDLIAETEEKFKYPLKTWTKVKNKETYTNNLSNLLVNKKKPSIETRDEFEEEGDICQEIYVTLQGATKYEIKYTREKTYNIDEDYYIGFRAKYIVNNFRVCLDYPDDIEVIFTCRGTQKDFEDVRCTKRRIEKKYKGIILPRQGYIFALRRKWNEN